MSDFELRDLGLIVESTREKLANEFSQEDIQLSRRFKDAFSKCVGEQGNTVEYKKSTAVISTSGGLKIYAPNQWFVLAAYAVDLLKEINRYRRYTELILDNNMDKFRNLDASLNDKQKIYKAFKTAPTAELEKLFRDLAREIMEGEHIESSVVETNENLLYRFVSDDKWWLGGKGIERSNDFYVSPALGVLNLVNASQSYVASIAYFYINDENLYAALPTIADGDDEDEYEENKRNFREWLENQVKPEGDSEAGQPYSKNTIDQYISNVDNTFIAEGVSLFATSDVEVARKCASDLDASERKNNTQRSAVQKYIKFLNHVMQENQKLVFHTGYISPSGFACNRILFGAPGTGKSFTINRERTELLGAENETDYERVTFHPDYSYANFVGTYKPVPCKDSDGKETITYKYVPGPFMRVYVNALKNGRTASSKPFLLIIEEINRANVAAVFGDVFQLLDRNEENVSEYPIQASEDIKNYLASELGGNPENYSKIRIPDNMFIWATMNSADQGVFPMDTAFKRRWDFTYLGINESEAELVGKTVVLGSGRSSQKVEWNKLRRAINNFLAAEKINEDKQLGPYFIARNIVVPEEGNEIDRDRFINTFKNKVIMYLFEDAAKQKRSKLFEGCPDSNSRYSEICKKFDEVGIDIFNREIRNEAEPIDLSQGVADGNE